MRLRLKRKVKVVLYVILLILFGTLLAFEINTGRKNLKSIKLDYTKQGHMNYVTYLKDNSHYNENSLKDDYSYVANLIDYFNLDYSYSYVLSDKIDYKLSYEVVANLEIYDSDNKSKPIEKKKFQILDKVEKEDNSQLVNIDLFNQVIDYETYNKIIQSWKKEVSPEATLKVQFKVDWSGFSKNLNKNIEDHYVNEFTIPISEKIISINKPSDTKESGIILSNQKLSTELLIMIISTGFIILLIITGLINVIIKINKNKSKYEQRVNKILREFDRAITEAKGSFVKSDEDNFIEINDFMELLDVHDNLNTPIIYYKDRSNLKSTFVVRNNNDIYYCVIRRDDYE